MYIFNQHYKGESLMTEKEEQIINAIWGYSVTGFIGNYRTGSLNINKCQDDSKISRRTSRHLKKENKRIG